jgi:hypothetical protein
MTLCLALNFCRMSFNLYLQRDLEKQNRDKRENFFARSSVVDRKHPHREGQGN